MKWFGKYIKISIMSTMSCIVEQNIVHFFAQRYIKHIKTLEIVTVEQKIQRFIAQRLSSANIL
jgi:hypothetical protein